jgi:hypothetical protein
VEQSILLLLRTLSILSLLRFKIEEYPNSTFRKSGANKLLKIHFSYENVKIEARAFYLEKS